MVIKREVAYGIVRGMSEFWKCEELQDFTVTLGTAQFGCHRFILAACSGFFRGLFRSGMKETELKCVSVEDISSETFELILETMYTGRGVLTTNNVLDIWMASNQLQITFLITECENFVIRSLSLENYVDYFHIGRNLNSKLVTETVWSFILKNANSFFDTIDFLKLPMPDVLSLVQSQNLVVISENDVLNAILKWAEFRTETEQRKERRIQYDSDQHIPKNSSNQTDDNEEINGCKRNSSDVVKLYHDRTDSNVDIQLTLAQSYKEQESECHPESSDNNLGILFCNTRACLASQDCLEMLIDHPLVSKNKMARETITRALLYQIQIGKTNGQWPSAAIHRNNSNFENVAISTRVTKESTLFTIYSFSENKWICSKIENLKIRELTALTTVDKYLYYFFITEEQILANEGCLSGFKLIQNSWSNIKVSLKLNIAKFNVIAMNEFIYIMQSKGKKMWMLQPDLRTLVNKTDLPDDQSICHLTCYEHSILVFYAKPVTSASLEKTIVQCYDTTKSLWTKLCDLEGTAYGMTSFKHDETVYLLQSTGDLWKIIRPQSDVIDFEHVIKLWSSEWSINGAVTFMDKLYIYGGNSETHLDDIHLRKSLPGLFNEVIYLKSVLNETSTFIPIILSRDCMAL